MANKSEEEIIKKPTASRGRPRKDAQASKTKKSSKSKAKKKTTKKSSSSKKSVSKKTKSTTLKVENNVELIHDVQIENTLPLTPIVEEVVVDEIIESEPDIIEEELIIQNESTEEVVIAEDEKDVLDVQEVNEEVLSEEENLEVQEQTIEKEVSPIVNEEPIVEKTKKKRTIKNISIKRPSFTIEEEISEQEPENQEVIEEPISEEPVVNKEIVPEKVIIVPHKGKRTLRLNLGSKKEEPIVEPSYKKDESINQNSAFFNEPSIFAKFNIDITTAENEETFENQDDIVENTSTSEEEISEIIENEQDNINELPADQLEELICDAITNTILEEQTDPIEENKTSEDLNTESLEQNALEEIANTISDEIIEEEIENSEILKSVRSILGGKLGPIEELDSDDENTEPENEQQEEIENNDNVILFKNLIEDEENIENNENQILVADQEEPAVLKEAADTIVSAEPVVDNTPVGKFFDSSIPSMTATVNNTFSKIKKSIFSNISPIFKKFTFEEAALITHQDDIENSYNENEQENNLSDIQKALENFTPNVQVLNNISDMDIQAESAISIPVIETNTIVSTKQDELDYAVPELNIITPTSESSFDEDEIIDELIENAEKDIIDEIMELDIYEELDEINDLDANEEIDEVNDLDINEEIDQVNEIENIETISLEENVEDEYNDDEFSIESYFGLDNVTLDEKDLKKLKLIDENEETKEIEEVIESTSNPDEFVDKFLETNPVVEEEIQEEISEEEPLNEENKEISTLEIQPEEFVDKLLEDNHVQVDINENEVSVPEVVNEETIEENTILESQEQTQESELEKSLKEKEQELSSLSKLLETFTQTISTLTNRITDLENKQLSENTVQEEQNEDLSNEIIENIIEESQAEIEEELNVDDIDIDDLDLDDIDLEDLDISEEIEEPSLLSQPNEEVQDEEKSVENILSEVLLAKDLDSELKEELLSEVLSYEENLSTEGLDESLLEAALLDELSDEDLLDLEIQGEQLSQEQESLSDFSKIIESLTKAITELEQTPDIKQEVEKTNKVVPLAPLPAELTTNYSDSDDKAINILINKDDIFSISILNESYEIVADFDGISVLSENLHLSTPKNNFFVRVGNKYIEIHNKKDHFVLNTNFEDIEFANAINNIAFAKKNNKIELNIKEAFKLSSVNNKIELSMLNKAIADLSTASQTPDEKEETSICDNKTLLISEETQKVYLPYTIEDVMKKLKSSDEYQTVQEVVDSEYTLPLSTFKMPIISRFKEAYRFMRTKENSSVYAAVDLALELMFNSNLNPAVIRAAKDMKELNIYLDCLYENEVEKFDCFKIVYKILPKIK